MPNEANMERILLLLSGEHPTLPYAEIFSLFDSEDLSYREVSRADQVLIIETEAKATRILEDRSAYVMEGGKFLAHSELSTEDLRRACDNIGWEFIQGKSFGVRVNRVRNYWRMADTQRMQCIIGNSVTEETDCRVNLESPDLWIRGIITDAGVFIFLLDFKTDRKVFLKRRPRTRPYFHPGVLEPKIARVFVNLSAVRCGEVFVDPFCGTGGFLIEAAMMGMKVVGIDIDKKMVKGAEMNLKHYGLECSIILGDAGEMPVHGADGISTDPPYGRGTSTGGGNASDVLAGFLKDAGNALRRGGRLCTAAPIELNPAKLASYAGLQVLEEHRMRVHKSLTRSIIIAKSV